MDYQTAVDTVIRPRSLAFLGGIRDALVALGVSAARITMEEPDTVDLRFQLSATGILGERFVCIVELTDTEHMATGVKNGKAVISLRCNDAFGGLDLMTYTSGLERNYTQEDGIAALIDKLDEVDAAHAEVIAKARLALAI